MNQIYIPEGYRPILDAYDTQRAIAYIKKTFQEEFANALHLKRVSAPLFVTEDSGSLSGAGQTAHAFVSRFGEKRDSSRALHPPSAARYFVGGIPPPCLARVRWRITRTVVEPFPCARSSHMRR